MIANLKWFFRVTPSSGAFYFSVVVLVVGVIVKEVM